VPIRLGARALQRTALPLRTYVLECVQSGHFAAALTRQFTFDALQRLLAKDGYGPQARNTRELGEALKAAGVTASRPTIKGKKVRMYTLPVTGASDHEIPFDQVL
jgi:hypothetical protein